MVACSDEYLLDKWRSKILRHFIELTTFDNGEEASLPISMIFTEIAMPN